MGLIGAWALVDAWIVEKREVERNVWILLRCEALSNCWANASGEPSVRTYARRQANTPTSRDRARSRTLSVTGLGPRVAALPFPSTARRTQHAMLPAKRCTHPTGTPTTPKATPKATNSAMETTGATAMDAGTERPRLRS